MHELEAQWLHSSVVERKIPDLAVGGSSPSAIIFLRFSFFLSFFCSIAVPRYSCTVQIYDPQAFFLLLTQCNPFHS